MLIERSVLKDVGVFTSLVLLAVLIATVLAGALGLLGCGAHVASGPFAKSPEHPHPTREFLACMIEPPPVDEIDWPTPDSVGNLLMHASTAERVKAAYAALVRWSRAQYYRCMHELESRGIDTTTVDVVDDAGVDE